MTQLVSKYRKFFLLALMAIFLNSSCDSDKYSLIPDVPVSLTINLNIVNDLTVPGNSAFFPGAGFGGIVVYCELPGSWYAFDAACTHELSSSCRVKNEGITGICPCCGSQFVFLGGTPTKGPAARPLKAYPVSVMNSSTIRVYN